MTSDSNNPSENRSPADLAAITAGEDPLLSETDTSDTASSQGGLFSLFGRLMGNRSSGSDVEEGLDEGQIEAVAQLSRGRREMIERVIAFDSKRVDDVMAPRADVVAIDYQTGLEELIKVFAGAGHSRLPIYRGDLDDPVGMAHLKDVIKLIANPDLKAAAIESDEPVLKTLRRDVLYVPPSMRVTDLLLRMQASRIHMALVIDEFGGTDGLVTIEDLVEEIVGDINDEHDDDDDEAMILKIAGGGWDVDARVELTEFAEEAGILLEAEDDEVDTLGGLVFTMAGRVPSRGEVLSHPSGYEFEITDANPRTVKRIRIKQRSAKSAVVPMAEPASPGEPKASKADASSPAKAAE